MSTRSLQEGFLSGLLLGLGWAETPAVVCNRWGQILGATEAARTVIAREVGLSELRGRLVAERLRGGGSLGSLLFELGAIGGGPFAWHSARVCACNREADLELLIRPLGSPPSAGAPVSQPCFAPEPDAGSGELVLVLLKDPGEVAFPQPRLLAALHGLTPTEARVASLLSGGLSPEQIRDCLQVSRETVKSHLRSLYAKTGTHRQSALVARLLSGLGRCAFP
jgi:DNA-binding CsgD family transcriptional regulator